MLSQRRIWFHERYLEVALINSMYLEEPEFCEWPLMTLCVSHEYGWNLGVWSIIVLYSKFTWEQLI